MNEAGAEKSPSLWGEIEELVAGARNEVLAVEEHARKLHSNILGESDKVLRECKAEDCKSPEGFIQRIRSGLRDIAESASRSNNKLRELR